METLIGKKVFFKEHYTGTIIEVRQPYRTTGVLIKLVTPLGYTPEIWWPGHDIAVSGNWSIIEKEKQQESEPKQLILI